MTKNRLALLPSAVITTKSNVSIWGSPEKIDMFLMHYVHLAHKEANLVSFSLIFAWMVLLSNYSSKGGLSDAICLQHP
jgi:hypothetical protein